MNIVLENSRSVIGGEERQDHVRKWLSIGFNFLIYLRVSFVTLKKLLFPEHQFTHLKLRLIICLLCRALLKAKGIT